MIQRPAAVSKTRRVLDRAGDVLLGVCGSIDEIATEREAGGNG